MTRIQLWDGDICDLEIDAIVNPANPSPWMATAAEARDRQPRVPA